MGGGKGKGRILREKAEAEEHKQLLKAWQLSGIDPTEMILCFDGAKKQHHSTLLKQFLERHCLTCETGFNCQKDLERHHDSQRCHCKNKGIKGKGKAGICSSCHQFVAKLSSHELSIRIPKQYHKMFVPADVVASTSTNINTGK